ncbi:MAG: nucleoside monophosphate kinase [Candidatus Saccharimonadales bacterium]
MILLMGIQGSGKGTQGSLLAEAYNLKLLSMGDIIRAHVTDEQRQRMLAGQLLTDEEATDLMDKALQEQEASQDTILDGYPRTVSQAQWLFEQAASGRFSVDHVIHLTARREAVKARLLSRGRADDTELAIEKRFDEYERATQPLFDWFAEQGIVVSSIDAERSVKAVNADLVKLVNQT